MRAPGSRCSAPATTTTLSSTEARGPSVTLPPTATTSPRTSPSIRDGAADGDDVAVNHFVLPHVDAAAEHADAVLIAASAEPRRRPPRRPRRFGRRRRGGRGGWHTGVDAEQVPPLCVRQVREPEHELGIGGAQFLAQLGAGGRLAVDGDGAVGDLDQPDAARRVARPQGDAVAEPVHLEAPLDVRAQGPRIGRARLRRRAVARDRQCGQHGEHVNRGCLRHREESSSDPSNRCKPNTATAPTPISAAITPEASGVTSVAAAARPTVPAIVQTSLPELSDAASQMQPFNVDVSRRTNPQAAIGSSK